MKEFVKPNVVISKCIEFEKCRYEGSIVNNTLVKRLKEYFVFYPLCPEVEVGLTVPRETLRLILDEKANTRLVFSKSGEDITQRMETYAKDKAIELSQMSIDGFLLKSKSPSCGVKDIKVYKSYGKAPLVPKKAKGVFAEIIGDYFNGLPIEDEGRLTNHDIREHFYTQLYTHSAFRKLKESPSMKKLVKFQSVNKYLFMAYNQSQLKNLGRLVANHQDRPLEEIMLNYEVTLRKLISTPPKPMKFVNVMLHIFGYFSNELSSKEKAYFLDLLEQYSKNQIPQSTIMAILKSWVVRFENEYLMEQSIFEPFPNDLIDLTDSGKRK
ncbi:uncharacterized protein YbgA (DUF1722 family) [Natranaerovirga hydrolytica]|uniref:Uncharacterized protein YbgA (DUF1722 family) n=1 Tax=Natranaerovirga hydrolytica TaxID=680378 RepID=A0A4R1MKG1_9FIRM|nr:DUF523 and DUF1722 domain-containing protein [Natranaerovirga hydrolytica]TCK93308.1 uncharacterized protein YbgA (DUF1722 family) [Natranaerovirga hydrolytica]